MSATAAAFKLVIVGDEGVGKHSLLNQFVQCQFGAPVVNSNLPATIHRLPLTTNLGVVEFKIWVANHGMSQPTQDENGSYEPAHLPDEFYANANVAIIMFDVTARQTYKNIPYWHRDIIRACDDIPIVLVGNKNDCVDRQVKPKMITFHRKKSLQYYDISTKAQYRILDPFVWLMQRLTNDPTLQLLDAELVAPEIDVANLRRLYEQLETDLNQAAYAMLLGDDDY